MTLLMKKELYGAVDEQMRGNGVRRKSESTMVKCIKV
jgi:hypothetical protein